MALAKKIGSPSNPNNWGGMTSRSISIKTPTAIGDGIDTVATTESPALVLDWTRWEFVREILPMRYVEMPANDKLPLLDAHQRCSADDVIGSAIGFKIDGISLTCKTYVSQSEPEIIQKIDEGHIDSVSIGYLTDPARTTEIVKNAVTTIDGMDYTNDFADSIPLVVRTWWLPKELSLVPIGADQAAKFRSEIRTLPEKKMTETEKTDSNLELRLAQMQAQLDTEKADRLEEKKIFDAERSEVLRIRERNTASDRYNNLRASAETLRGDGKLTNAGFDAIFSLKTESADPIELLDQLSKTDPIEFHLRMIEKYAVPVKFGSKLANEPLQEDGGEKIKSDAQGYKERNLKSKKA